ncbi:MAG: hypothetical protein HYV33_00040 [Candidatus Kerfeldbacteria bacterium]|nr:hypothetical protein [Candidatus Kerfeldbacteria bacterium]
MLIGLRITVKWMIITLWRFVTGGDVSTCAYSWAKQGVQQSFSRLGVETEVQLNGELPPANWHIVAFGNHPHTSAVFKYVEVVVDSFGQRPFKPTGRKGLLIGWGLRAIGGILLNRDVPKKARRELKHGLTKINQASLVTIFCDGRRFRRLRLAKERERMLKEGKHAFRWQRYTLRPKVGGLADLCDSLPAERTAYFRVTVTFTRFTKTVWEYDIIYNSLFMIHFKICQNYLK